MSNRMSRAECVALYDIDLDFFDTLAASGLLKVVEERQELYISYEDLDDLERYANMYYDLEISVAGLEVIARLLDDIRSVREENRRLKQGSARYGSTGWEDMDIEPV